MKCVNKSEVKCLCTVENRDQRIPNKIMQGEDPRICLGTDGKHCHEGCKSIARDKKLVTNGRRQGGLKEEAWRGLGLVWAVVNGLIDCK